MQSPPNAQKPKPAVPEMVGATSAPFSVGKGITTISFDLHAPTGPALLRADGKPRRVFLRIERITSPMPVPSFEVYLNLPPRDAPEKHPELHGGVLSMFGLVESNANDEHVPGLTYSLEVTDVFLLLAKDRDWDGKTLRVSFMPIMPWDYPLEVHVGRVSLYFE